MAHLARRRGGPLDNGGRPLGLTERSLSTMEEALLARRYLLALAHSSFDLTVGQGHDLDLLIRAASLT